MRRQGNPDEAVDVTAQTPMVEFRGVSKVHGAGPAAVRALVNVDLKVNPGEFVAVTGPSGSGKSTCMNILGCLDTPTSGQHFLDSMDVGRLLANQRALVRRHLIGFVFQGFNLLARTTALENVELPLVYRGVAREQRRSLAMNALEIVGLAARARHTPSELSGGEQQRVAIARAIVTQPPLLLADEPTGNLDTRTTSEIMNLLTSLNSDQRMTIVMVTHEPEVAACAKRIIRFVDGEVEIDSMRARHAS